MTYKRDNYFLVISNQENSTNFIHAILINHNRTSVETRDLHPASESTYHAFPVSTIYQMILPAFLIISLIPVGITSKKIYREVVPSRPLLRNPLKQIGNARILLRVFLLACSIASTWFLYRQSIFHMLIGVTAFISGWQMSVIGLTGGIATGKSTVSEILGSKTNCLVIDADKVARDCVKKGSIAHRQIVKTFGPQVLDAQNGEINRGVLGNLVFSDGTQRAKLEAITHPWILLHMLRLVVVNRIMGKEVVLDVPLLFEPKTFPLLYLICSEIIFIDLDRREQMKRLQLRNPELTEEEISNRIKSQMGREEKLVLADYVILNKGTISDLERNVLRFFKYPQ